MFRFINKFRTDVLKMKLQDVEDISGTKLKTLSAFEQGRSTNINHLQSYFNACSTIEQENLFIELLKAALKESKNGN